MNEQYFCWNCSRVQDPEELVTKHEYDVNAHWDECGWCGSEEIEELSITDALDLLNRFEKRFERPTKEEIAYLRAVLEANE